MTVAWPQCGPPPGVSDGLPSRVAPSRNTTGPDGGTGGPVLGGAAHTVSVNVTGSPNSDGFGDDPIVVETGARPTTWVSVAALGVKLSFPLYVAGSYASRRSAWR